MNATFAYAASLPGTMVHIDDWSDHLYACPLSVVVAQHRGGRMDGSTRAFAIAQREQFGVFQWQDWPGFFLKLGLNWMLADLPATINGFVYGQTVCLRRDLCPASMALTAWHEVGHYLLHDGGVEWWSKGPQGDVTVAKFERQADLFAAFFPCWEDDGA